MKTKKDTRLTIYTSTENVELFNNLYTQFIIEIDTDKIFYKRDFFQLMLKNYKQYLEQAKSYWEIDNPDKIKNIIGKRGRRKKEQEDKVYQNISLGKKESDEAMLGLFYNIVYSIVKKGTETNILNYNKTYFFEKILYYTADNFKKIIKAYKHKQ